MAVQSFGEHFNLKKLIHARDVAREMTYKLSSQIRPGMQEHDAVQLYRKLKTEFAVEKDWHPPKIRFGKNTIKSFYDQSEPHTLQEEDIFFIDIGPVIEGHEADYGETFTIGNIFEQKLIANYSTKLFSEVGKHWLEKRCAGPELYRFAKSKAESSGFILDMGSDGHRIGDFPHHVHFKGAIIECAETIIPNAWILEIHVLDKSKNFGAFYEDILTDIEL